MNYVPTTLIACGVILVAFGLWCLWSYWKGR